MKRYATLTAVLLLALATAAFAFQPGPYDMIIQAGEDYVMTAVESNNGTPINLTGNTYQAQCGSAPGSAAFFNFSAFNPNPTAGEIRLKLSRAQSMKNAGKSGVWWLKRYDVTDQASYRLAGKCAVVPR